MARLAFRIPCEEQPCAQQLLHRPHVLSLCEQEWWCWCAARQHGFLNKRLLHLQRGPRPQAGSPHLRRRRPPPPPPSDKKLFGQCAGLAALIEVVISRRDRLGDPGPILTPAAHGPSTILVALICRRPLSSRICVLRERRHGVHLTASTVIRRLRVVRWRAGSRPRPASLCRARAQAATPTSAGANLSAIQCRGPSQPHRRPPDSGR